ncbi:MAG: alkaline phosphatase [Bryobacteraceae bacterium]|nr:alkaline phosphatase [Bryobacteraceae bacterium]
MIRTILVLLAVSALAPVFGQQKVVPKRAKNVILLLADAGGIPVLNAASILAYNAPQKLYVQSWPHVGLSDTSPTGKWVTDSAAGMTAIVTGSKTFNGVISQAPDGARGVKDGTPLKTILEHAEEHGLSTGVMSNMNIADATPAACYAHANDRKKHGEIFLEVFSPRFGDGIDVLFGPGRREIWEKARMLGKDPDEVAKEHGRKIYTSLADVPPDALRALAVVEGEFDHRAAARIAISILSKNPKGYFLMIEGDSHTDEPREGLGRLIAFDKLIREISEMVNPEETLLLFTADHSFDFRINGGGPDDTLLQGIEEWSALPVATRKQQGMRLPHVRMNNSHTAEEVLAAAKGPGAERVRGFLPNTDLFHVMMSAYGWQ